MFLQFEQIVWVIRETRNFFKWDFHCKPTPLASDARGRKIRHLPGCCRKHGRTTSVHFIGSWTTYAQSLAIFPQPQKIPQWPALHLSHIPTITLCKGKKKRTKLFARVKSVPNHKKPEAKNLLYTFLLSELILSSGIYNYTGTTSLWRMRKYNTIISSQTSTEIWQKSTRAENTPPSPFPSPT